MTHPEGPAHPETPRPAAHGADPAHTLSVFDAVAILVGLVVGIGIFRTPSIVAGNVSSEWMFIGAWLLGGLVTWVGALCYAELAAADPHTGGEYHLLSRAYGRPVAMMFGWARCTVIQTGAIAAVAFVLGDYLQQLLPLGSHGPAIYAALSVVLLTAVNVKGTLEGKNLQIFVTGLQILIIVAMVAAGLWGAGTGGGAEAAGTAAPQVPPATAALGMAMIFVLLTYGGWNEAAYLTGELRDAPRNIAKVLAIGTALVVAIYVLTNWALLAVLGLDGLRASQAVVSDMMRSAFGPWAETAVTLAIVVAAISTLNATIFTGARVFYVMANDLSILRWVGVWRQRGSTPANGQILQGSLALALIGLGALTKDGFKAMVDYTAPVFWGFMLLVALSLIVRRLREPQRVLPYRVPLYPLTPLVFVLTCVYMLHASLVYTGSSAWIGVAVLLSGVPLLFFQNRSPADAVPTHKGVSS